MDSSNTQPPIIGPQFPTYPHLMQVVRVTGTTVPGPSGYASSSALGPSLYVGFVQQTVPATLLLRDREPCFVNDVNRQGLAPGYYSNARLSSNYQSLPVYSVSASSAVSALSPYNGLTPTQVQQLSTLSPAQMAVLANLNPCQLQVLLTSLPISQIHTLTSGVLTATQLTNLVALTTTSQLTALYSQLTTSQIITLTTALNQYQVQTLVSVLTPAEVQTAVTGLTQVQLQNLAEYPPAIINALVSSVSAGTMTIANLATLLSITPLPTDPVTTYATQTAAFTSGTQNNVAVYGSTLQVPTSGATTINGLVPLDPSSAQEVTLYNTGTSTLSITNQNAGSSAANRFATSTGATISIAAGSSLTVDYNPTTGRWVDSGASVVNSSGSAPSACPQWVAFTKTFSDFSDPGTAKTITLTTLAANQVISEVFVKHTTSFTGGTVSSTGFDVGVTGSSGKYTPNLSSMNLTAATGDVPGTSCWRAGFAGTQSSQGKFDSSSGTTTVEARLTSVGGNLNALTAGSVTVRLLLSTLP